MAASAAASAAAAASSAAASAAPQQHPIVVVLGCTGVGKTKLSIELAKRFNGEIISTDSMQVRHGHHPSSPVGSVGSSSCLRAAGLHCCCPDRQLPIPSYPHTPIPSYPQTPPPPPPSQHARLQVYRGLDIATNKASAAERAQAPHHLLDFLEPPQTYDVQQFRDAALAVIAGWPPPFLQLRGRKTLTSPPPPPPPTPKDLHAQGKLPILVGGTHYYNESIIFRNLLDEVAGEGAHARAGASGGDANASAATPTASPEVLARLAALSAEDAADELARVDPVMANRLHRNDTRKILRWGWGSGVSTIGPPPVPIPRLTPSPIRSSSNRSLEVFYATGQRQSELIMQQTDRGEEVLRFAPCCCLYLDCEQTALDARLDARVDDMLAQGLLAELEAFQARMAAASPDGELDYTRGLLQAIGFKEFREYMAAGDDCAPADKARLLEAGVADMKRATRRYARRQTTWIRNRLLRGLLLPIPHTESRSHSHTSHSLSNDTRPAVRGPAHV